MNRQYTITVALFAFLLLPGLAQAAAPLGPGFTYQGRYDLDGSPVTSSVHLRFSLWDAEADGTPVGASQTLTDIPVTEGIFTVVLNASEEFGADAFDGDARWLQIEVCDNAACDTPTLLSPRQPVTPTPYALSAHNALSAPWAGLTDVPAGFADGVDNSADSVWGVTETNIFYEAGKVGIGTATPHHQLRVSGGPHWTSNLWVGSLELDNAAAIGWQSNGAKRFGIGQSTGGLYFFHTDSDPGTTENPAVYDLQLTDTGNVLISGSLGIGAGATSPDFPLTINTGGFGYGLVHSDGVHEVGTYLSASGGWLGTRSDHPLHFFTHDSQPRMTISTEGNVGIGTSNPDSSVKLDVASEIDGSAIRSYAPTGIGVYGVGLIGVDAQGQGPLGIGIFAHGESQAGKFIGDVVVNGVFTDQKSTFQIDHPLDPENKVLSHSSVDSPDMKNIYDGTVVTDAQGYVTVTLPDYFEALNKDFRYQLTVIDDTNSDHFVQAKVVKKIEGNQFTIRTSQPNVEVSWQVTGIRQDAFAKANPMEVEKVKPEKDRGKYLAPEVYGQPKEMGIGYRPELERSSGTVSRD